MQRGVDAGLQSDRLTYDDLAALPDDDLRHEIIGGVHYVTASPVTRHQRLVLRLAAALQEAIEGPGGAELFISPYDVVLSPHDVVVPDLLVVCHERSDRITEKNLQGAPDLVVEILSPSTSGRDQGLKRDLYARCGVTEYWVVDPEGTVAVHRRGGDGFGPLSRLTAADALTTPVVPGFELSLERFFA